MAKQPKKRRVRKDGLYLRGRVWWCRIGGERRSTECKDVEAARIVRARLEREAADPAASLARRTTVMDMLAHVLEDRRTATGKTGGTLSPETLEVWRVKLGHFVRVVGPSTPLAEVDFDLVGKYLEKRERERAGQHTRSKELGALRFALRLEKQRGAYSGDVDHVTRKSRYAVGYKPRKRHLSWEEIPLLLAALIQEDPQRVTLAKLEEAMMLRAAGLTLAQVAHKLRCAISTAKRYLTMCADDLAPKRGGDLRARHAAWFIATGGRDAESHRAELADHVLTEANGERRWTVRIRGTKTGRADAVIPIAAVFHQLLEFALEGAPAAGSIFTEWTNVGRSLKLACERAGIERVSPNDLRRTHMSLLSQAGIPNSELKHISRHTTTRMLDLVYAHTNNEALTRALDRVPARNLLPSTTPSHTSRARGKTR